MTTERNDLGITIRLDPLGDRHVGPELRQAVKNSSPQAARDVPVELGAPEDLLERGSCAGRDEQLAALR